LRRRTLGNCPSSGALVDAATPTPGGSAGSPCDTWRVHQRPSCPPV
jgi:hypothetical protein